MLNRFDQYRSAAVIACFGDASSLLFVPGGVFRGDQAEERQVAEERTDKSREAQAAQPSVLQREGKCH